MFVGKEKSQLCYLLPCTLYSLTCRNTYRSELRVESILTTHTHILYIHKRDEWISKPFYVCVCVCTSSQVSSKQAKDLLKKTIKGEFTMVTVKTCFSISFSFFHVLSLTPASLSLTHTVYVNMRLTLPFFAVHIFFIYTHVWYDNIIDIPISYSTYQVWLLELIAFFAIGEIH